PVRTPGRPGSGDGDVGGRRRRDVRGRRGGSCGRWRGGRGVGAHSTANAIAGARTGGPVRLLPGLPGCQPSPPAYTPNTAPCGSRSTAIRRPPGRDVGSIRTVPAAPAVSAAVMSTSSTAKYGSQCGGTSGGNL